jgi:hypothetical protein
MLPPVDLLRVQGSNQRNDRNAYTASGRDRKGRDTMASPNSSQHEAVIEQNPTCRRTAEQRNAGEINVEKVQNAEVRSVPVTGTWEALRLSATRLLDPQATDGIRPSGLARQRREYQKIASLQRTVP